MAQTIKQPQTAGLAKLCWPAAFIKKRERLHGLGTLSAASQRFYEAQRIQQPLTRCARELFQQGQRQRPDFHRCAQHTPGATPEGGLRKDLLPPIQFNGYGEEFLKKSRDVFFTGCSSIAGDSEFIGFYASQAKVTT